MSECFTNVPAFSRSPPLTQRLASARLTLNKISTWIYTVARRFFNYLSFRTYTHTTNEHLLFVTEEFMVDEDDTTSPGYAVLI
jgi:hypothetical protein